MYVYIYIPYIVMLKLFFCVTFYFSFFCKTSHLLLKRDNKLLGIQRYLIIICFPSILLTPATVCLSVCLSLCLLSSPGSLSALKKQQDNRRRSAAELPTV